MFKNKNNTKGKGGHPHELLVAVTSNCLDQSDKGWVAGLHFFDKKKGSVDEKLQVLQL